jgi:hypothetical protein
MPLNVSSGWLALGPRLVGLAFLWTGAIKAVEPHGFSRHLRQLGWIPDRLIGAAVVIAAGFEAGWGLALILGLASPVMLPATLILLGILAALSWWGVKSGRASDCGCYGGYIQPSIGQSVALDAIFALLVLVAWLGHAPGLRVTEWNLLLVGTVAVVFGGLAAIAQQFESRNGRPLFSRSPLKVGRRWRAAWAAGTGAASNDPDETIVSYLGPDCPHCRQWVRVMNAMQQSPTLPRVIGIVGTTTERMHSFVEETGIKFPIAAIPEALMGRLTYAVPTTVLVQGGTIRDKWVGPMPPEFFGRFKQAFFPEHAGQRAEL